MPLFSHKNNQVIPAVLHPTVPQRQYLYNEHNRLVPSPPPPPFVEGNRRSFYSVSVPRKFKGTASPLFFLFILDHTNFP